ncbi:MAG: sulfurtransferase TusA family protein [Rhodospirillales bacterium]|nr:sulfurtransferase TusA family protein [Rhodospirillales bacterium]
MNNTKKIKNDLGADVHLDITDQVCPLTFVRTKLMIERMRPGQVAEVRLKGGEPLENVPRSVREIGHTVLSLEPEDDAAADGVHILRLRKEAAG